MSERNAESNSRLLILVGMALALAALCVLAGWIFRQPAIVRMLPGSPMVFTTAFGFAVAGIALAIGAFLPASRKPAHTGAGLMLAGLGLLALAQYGFGFSAGFDLPALHAWAIDPARSPTPGRMAPATAAGFVLSGAVFLLAPRVRGLAQTVLVRVLTVAAGALGALAIAGYLLDLADVLEVRWLAQIPLPTALCFVLLCVALWLDWRGEPWNGRRLLGGEDDRIALSGALVLAISILASGLVVFWVMWH